MRIRKEKTMHKFSGKWITDKDFAEPLSEDVEAKKMPMSSHILFRTRFVWDKAGRVRLYFSADDYCKVYVNGKLAAQGPAPCYTHHTYYVSKDITKYLQNGENVIAFHTYYQGLVNRVWVSGDSRHGLIFDVFSSGRLLVCSDERVLCARHTGYSISHIVGYDTQFMENYDSRADETGFEMPAYDDSSWTNAALRKEAAYRLFPQPSKNLVYETMLPKKTERSVGPLYDFGQEFVGNPYIRARGNAGDRVEIRLAEELDADGNARYQMRCNCDYKEMWTLSGKTDAFLPFDYKAFRYMQLVCPPTVEILAVEGRARHYPFRLIRRCGYSDERKQKIFDLCVNTLRYGLQEGYLDCPSREKGQYFGDGAWSALSHVYLTGDTSLCKKFIENAFESTGVDEGMTAQGPCAFVQKIAEFPLFVVILLKGYLHLTGDDKFVRKQKKKVTDLLRVYRDRYFDREKGLLSVYDRWNVVEWPASARDGYDFRLEQNETVYGFHNVMNAYYLYALKVCRELYAEEIIDTEQYERTYLESFYDAEHHLFRDSPESSHTAISSQLFGVFLGLGDDTARDKLLEMIRQKRLTCSNLFITPVLFLWLHKAGYKELLSELLCDEGAWLNMLKEGATTTFEAFSKDQKVNASLFHTMFAFPVLFLGDRDAF